MSRYDYHARVGGNLQIFAVQIGVKVQHFFGQKLTFPNKGDKYWVCSCSPASIAPVIKFNHGI